MYSLTLAAALTLLGAVSASAITIDFASPPYSVGTGQVLEQQPNGVTGTGTWTRTTNSGTTTASLELIQGTGSNPNYALSQAGTSAIPSSQYGFTPTATDLGGTFTASSSIVNYSFQVTYTGTNTSSLKIMSAGLGANLANFSIDFFSNGEIGINASSRNGGAGSDLLVTTVSGGNSTYTFHAIPNTPYTISGQVNYASNTFTVTVNKVVQTNNNTFGTNSIGSGGSALYNFLVNGGTDQFVVQNLAASSTAWLPIEITNINLSLVVPSAYNLTVQESPLRQTFQGFGMDVFNTSWFNVPDTYKTQRETLSQMLYTDCNATVVRFETPMGTGTDLGGSKTFAYYTSTGSLTAAFSKEFSDPTVGGTNAFVDIMTENPKVTTLLVMPDTLGSGPPANMTTYTDLLAGLIYYIQTTYLSGTTGVTIATGIANEPTSAGWTSQNLVDGVNDLKASLTKAGVNMSNVEIVAPECSNAYLEFDQTLQDYYTDPLGSWDVLSGLACHDYGLGTSDDQEDIANVIGDPKPYWITESCQQSNQCYLANSQVGADAVARFCNDLNHSASHWLFWNGLQGTSNPNTQPDSGGALLCYYNTAPYAPAPFLNYYYMRQALNTVLPGAVIRRCQGDEGDMLYSTTQPGQSDTSSSLYPHINATAGLNPDGSWGIVLVNDATALDQFHQPATDYNVMITVPELKNNSGNITFSEYVDGGTNGTYPYPLTPTATLTMSTSGQLTVPINSGECICLKSNPTTVVVPPPPTGLTLSPYTVTSGGYPTLYLTWDMTGQATTWTVYRSINGGTYSKVATTTTTAYEDPNVSGASTVSYEVVANDSAGKSPLSSTVTVTPVASSVWNNYNINTTLTGTATFAEGGIFTVSGYGDHTPLSSTADSGDYFAVSQSGAQTITARLKREYVFGTSYASYAGLAIRQGTSATDAGAPGANLTVEFNGGNSPSESVVMYTRTTESGTAVKTKSTTIASFPIQITGADPVMWLKLSYDGVNTISSSYSTDGTTWSTPVNSTGTFVWGGGSMYTGLFSTSATTAAINLNAIFDNVSITTP